MAQRCPAVPPARSKGPAVWLEMDQQDIDEAYDNDVYAFNAKTINDRRVYNNQIGGAGMVYAPLEHGVRTANDPKGLFQAPGRRSLAAHLKRGANVVCQRRDDPLQDLKAGRGGAEWPLPEPVSGCGLGV